MVDRELQDLRRHLRTLLRGRGRRFPATLRERITVWIASRRKRGDWWGELARELGVPARTLKRWAMPRPQRAVLLRPVDVISEPVIRTVTLVAPNGMRVEDVTIADAISILRSLM